MLASSRPSTRRRSANDVCPHARWAVRARPTLSPRCLGLLKDIGLWDKMAAQAYGIRGCRFVAPSGAEALLCGREGAWIIPRATFDAGLAWDAERAGARFIQGFKATRLLCDGA